MFFVVSFVRNGSRAAKPGCRADVVMWFREVERERGAGVNPSTGKVSKWFHGELTFFIYLTFYYALYCKIKMV